MPTDMSADEEDMATAARGLTAVGIAPEDVVKFAPGKILAEANAGLGERRRLFYRDFSYEPSMVDAPGVDTLLMVVYREGRTTMRGRVEGGWQQCVIEPRTISILGPGKSSEWEWDESISAYRTFTCRASSWPTRPLAPSIRS